MPHETSAVCMNDSEAGSTPSSGARPFAHTAHPQAPAGTPAHSRRKSTASRVLQSVLVISAIVIFVVSVNVPAFCKPWGLGYILMHGITPCIIPTLRGLQMLRDPALQDYSWDIFWQHIEVAEVEWREKWEQRGGEDHSEDFLEEF